MTSAELDRNLRYLHGTEPDLHKRIIALALRQTGQEHGVGTLGEYPVDGLSDGPMVDIETSDCVTFVEQTLAMALSDGWRPFFAILQRIRYRNGIIGWETRNHFIESDWLKNNGWLVEDANERLGKNLLVFFDMEIERDKFFAENGRHNPFPPERVRLSYFPVERINDVLGRLTSGMIFMMIRSNYSGKKWAGHLGFILVEGKKIYMVHSRMPEVRRDLFLDYMNDQLGKNPQRIRENRPFVIGFSFLAIHPDPIILLRKTDGPDAPRIIIYGKNP